MSKLKVLYVASEIRPFLENSSVGSFLQSLPKYMCENGIDVRIVVPRFGVIGVRKNKIHEVVRLSGMSILVGNQKVRIIVRSSSIPEAKLHVYFIDSEEYFERKFVFHDEDDIFFEDNAERIIFFCKGVLETVKRLEWAPDIIHCHDWVSSLIPVYLKTLYVNDSILRNSRSVFTLYNNVFRDKLNSTFIEKLNISNKDILDSLASVDFKALISTALMCSDMAFKTEVLSDELFNGIDNLNNVVTIEHTNDGIKEYHSIYNNLKFKSH